MKKTGIFYGTQTTKTASVAKKIIEAFGNTEIDVIDVYDATEADFEKYDNIIAGASTWFDGELPTYWDETLPMLEASKLKGKKVAIFGLGDQVEASENFADASGILAEAFEAQGAKLVGFTSTGGYTFEASKAQRGNQFVGLVIDIENQNKKTKERIESWVKQLEKEFS